MKKVISILLFVMLSIVLVACGSEESTMSSDSKEKGNNKDAKTEQKSEKETANLEVASEAYDVWTNSIGTTWVNYSAEIKNIGKKAAKVGDIQINFEGKDGSILGTESMILSVPDVVQSGESAYVTTSTILEGYKEADFSKASMNMDFNSVDEETQSLSTDAVKMVDLSKEPYSSTPYKVTGAIINDSGAKADDIRVSAGLYDASGKLLGVMNTSLDISLNEGSKAGFEIQYPDLPMSIAGKATEVKVKAYNWTF